MANYDVTKLAFECEVLEPSETLVLLAVGQFCNPDGTCYPSQARIARMTRLSRRTVVRATKRLRELGLVEVLEQRKRPDGGDSTLMIRVCMERVPKYQHDTGGVGHGVMGGVTPCRGGVGHGGTAEVVKKEDVIEDPPTPKGEEESPDASCSATDLTHLMTGLWEVTPAKSRRRTTRAKVERQLKRLKPTMEEAARMVRWLRWRTRQEDWEKEDGEFMPALDRIVRDKGWLDDPDPAEREERKEAQRKATSYATLPEPEWNWFELLLEIDADMQGREGDVEWGLLPRDYQEEILAKREISVDPA